MEPKRRQDDAAASITVLLVDDHPVVREGYKRLIERTPDLRVAGEASTAADAFRIFAERAPDVTVMDISLPDLNGIEALRSMLASSPDARVVMFSIHREPVYAERALRAGARGYLTKASAPELLARTIRAVFRGDVVVSSDMSSALNTRSAEQVERTDTLSKRELEIARLLVEGPTVQAIAERLGLAFKTVANCQTAIRRKLGAPTPVRLLQVATRYGIIAPPR